MKEATGEANITVITIVLIAIVLAVGTLIVNNVMNKTKESSCCNSNGGVWYNGSCFSADQCSESTLNGKQVFICDTSKTPAGNSECD